MRKHRWLAATTLLLALGDAEAGWFDGHDAITEPFLKQPNYAEIALSPGGTRLARVGYDDKQFGHVWVSDLDKQTEWTMGVEKELQDDPVTHRRGWFWLQPTNLRWIAEDSLAIDYVSGTERKSKIYHESGKSGLDLSGTFIGVVRPDGEHANVAVFYDKAEGRPKRVELPDFTPKPGAAAQSFAHLPLGKSFPETGLPLHWLSDASGTLRTVQTFNLKSDGTHGYLLSWSRRGEGQPWQLAESHAYGGERFEPVGLTDDPDRILVTARNGEDYAAVWRYDVVRHAFVDKYVAQPGADVVRVLRAPGDASLESVATDGLDERTVWLDERMRKAQESVDRTLPGHVNRLQPGGPYRVLVDSSSDVDPGHAYVLDTRTMKMETIAAKRPDIDPARMQPMQQVHYPAPDGVDIPAYLTLPGKPARPVPLVVLIHGGPQSRDRWGWNEEVQVYAAHGYAVFQPQFRGSTGFGRKFEEAGYGQWGKAMQDDITAGVHWLVGQHIADPRRICIVGASYGGYAALWGLVKTPELYRCGVSVAGVADLKSELTEDSDISKDVDVAERFRLHSVGDPAKVTTDFEAISPLAHADGIGVPVLIVHGDLDQRVPLRQGRRMADALEAAHKDVRWLEFPREAHGIADVDDRRKYYEAVFELFKRTIGEGEPPRR